MADFMMLCSPWLAKLARCDVIQTVTHFLSGRLMSVCDCAALEYVHGAAVGAQRFAFDFDRQEHARVRVPRDHAGGRAVQGQVVGGDFDDALGVFV